ncbi:MAG: glycosyltransferase family 2 protein [bacterium]
MNISNLTIITISEKDITDFSKVRNLRLKEATTDWVLFLDSDEQLTPKLEGEINKAIKFTSYAAYNLKRQDTFLGRTLKFGETANVKLIRLARRDFGLWQRPVHECWVGEGRVGELKNPLHHNPHKTISNFLEKINKYSTIEANYRFQNQVSPTLLHVIFYPPAKFLRNYILLQGFRDGVPGLIMALMMSFHSFLTWTKLYLLCKKD